MRKIKQRTCKVRQEKDRQKIGRGGSRREIRNKTKLRKYMFHLETSCVVTSCIITKFIMETIMAL